MNPGDSCDSEGVPGPTNDVNGSNLESRRDAAAARLENGSNHVQVEKSDIDRSEKDPCPSPPTTKPIPVQIRLISREGEEKSIQKQLGESVEVRLITEPCESPAVVAALNLDNNDATAAAGTSSGSSRLTRPPGDDAQQAITNGSHSSEDVAAARVPAVSPEVDGAAAAAAAGGEEEEEDVSQDSNRNAMSNMAILANTSRLRSLCKLGYPEELDKFLMGVKDKPGALDIDVATEDGWTCLHDMITHECQFTHVASVLIKHGANVNTSDLNGDSPLHSALLYHNTDNIKLLLEGGSDTEATNNIGRRPIHIANDPESLQLLLDHGADVDSQDRVGNAAIHFAVLAKDRERVEILLDKGCDITVRNRAGSTPLHLAPGDTAITQLLLSSKADPNSLDNAENSPLHLAVRGRHKDVVRLLLSAQADAHQFNCNGKSPLNLAKDKEMKNILLGKEEASLSQLRKDSPAISRKDSSSNSSSNSGRCSQTPVSNGSSSLTLSSGDVSISQPSPVIASPSILKRKKMEEDRPHVGPRLRFSDVNDYSGVEDPMECGLPAKRVKVPPIYTDPPQFSDDEDED